MDHPLGLASHTWGLEVAVSESCLGKLELELSEIPIPTAVKHLDNSVKSLGGSLSGKVDYIKSNHDVISSENVLPKMPGLPQYIYADARKQSMWRRNFGPARPKRA